MIDSVDNFHKALDHLSAQYTDLFQYLPQHSLNLKPSAERWSLGQILEHIILLNCSYFPIIQQANTGALKLPWISTLPFIYKRFGRLIISSVNPENVKKSKTFKIWKPVQSSVRMSILEDFIHHHEELKKLSHSTSDLFRKDKLIHSPANKFIVYPLSTAYQMMVLHEQRHLIQAQETAQQIS